MSSWDKYVYILSNKNRTVFYVGVTGNLKQRMLEKRIKNWHRDWKLNLVKEKNPLMVDLAMEWFYCGRN